jgi:hypothetical protein
MKEKQEQDKHRHHKQPQSFLKGFAAAGNQYQKKPDIWVYKKGRKYQDGINPSLESVKNTGYGEDFYAFVNEDGNKDFNKYENLLMKEFEQPAQAVLERIRNLEEINEVESKLFIKYVASMAVRGDWWREVTDKAFADATLKIKHEFYSKHKTKIDKVYTQEEFEKIIENGANNLKASEHSSKEMIRKAKDLSEIIKQMSWRFLVAPVNSPYLTSDNPVFYFKLKNPESELIFPVSSSVTLSLSWKEVISATRWKKRSKSFWDVDNETVAQIRDRICYVAIDEVYYSKNSKWLVEFLNKRNRHKL